MIKIILETVNGILSHFACRKLAYINPSEKYVTFTFDDVPSTGFINGVEILNNAGKKGTFYVSINLLGNFFKLEDLNNCINSGHELGCHTYEHKNLSTLKSGEIKYQIDKNQEAMKEINDNVTFENFSFPKGAKSITSKCVVSKRFKSCRGTERGFNVKKVDVNNLRTIPLYERRKKLKKIKRTLNKFDKSGGWLIFYTHDIQENFTKYGCSKEYFKSVVAECINRGYEIITVKEMVKKLTIIN